MKNLKLTFLIISLFVVVVAFAGVWDYYEIKFSNGDVYHQFTDIDTVTTDYFEIGIGRELPDGDGVFGIEIFYNSANDSNTLQVDLDVSNDLTYWHMDWYKSDTIRIDSTAASYTWSGAYVEPDSIPPFRYGRLRIKSLLDDSTVTVRPQRVVNLN